MGRNWFHEQAKAWLQRHYPGSSPVCTNRRAGTIDAFVQVAPNYKVAKTLHVL